MRDQPPAFELRRLRRFHGTRPLTQKALGRRAHLTTRQVRHYEAATTLPRVVRHLVSLADALGVPLDALIARRYRRDGPERL